MNTAPTMAGPSPIAALRDASPYSAPTAAEGIDLRLDANEGPALPIDTGALLARAARTEALRRYPSVEGLRSLVAERAGITPQRVAITAGGDDAIDRLCRSVLAPGREIILTPPTFEMFERYAALAGATVTRVPWGLAGPASWAFPTDAVLSRVSDRTAAIAIVAPNNPTGLCVTPDAVRRISTGAPRTLIILDLAYAEFDDADLQTTALGLPNVVCVRTFSKAWGLAGLRVGYALGPEPIIRWARAAGGPYPVSGLSAEAARLALETLSDRVAASVARVRLERERLTEALAARGLAPWTSHANFVTTGADGNPSGLDPAGHLARRGIAVRTWAARPDLPPGSARITCPGDDAAFERLVTAIREFTP
ncbi:MAG: histidinol-phosphate aminotransferase family protein [Phycisphaeraceae bacterium]|nr:MAG: histidinol-phosphate aminotransferase family protein [Phycisphaeraceae bacterium]